MTTEERRKRPRGRWRFGRLGRILRIRWTALSLALLVVVSSAAQAKMVIGVEDWGLGGAVKAGLWTPLYLELKSTGEDFTGALEVEVRADQRVRPIFTKPVTLIKDTPTQHWLYFRSPCTAWRQGHRQEFAWQLRDRKGRVVLRSPWERPVVLPAGDTVVAVFRVPGVSGAGLGGLFDADSALRTNVVMLTPKTAPDHRLGYQGADVLVWVNPDPSQMTSVAQREALLNYVTQGGHLVLAAGTGWQALTGSFLAELLPARPTASDLVADLPALRPYGLPRAPKESLVLMRLEDVRGEVLMEHQGRPVIVRGPVGLGRVSLVGFDPTKSPFAGVDPTLKPRFWSMVLGIDVISKAAGELGAMDPVSGPLIRALNDFPGFKPINFTFIVLFLIGYVILIGPADYFILKRLKKLHWTWVTFPSIAVVASVLAFWLLSSERIRGLLANSISVVDASAGGDEIAGTTFMTFLSPRQTRYTVTLAPGTVGSVAPREFQVFGPGPGLGMTGSTCRVYGAGEVIDRLLVRIWDAQTTEASWRTAAPALPDVALFRQGGVLRGTVTNSTPDALGDAVVLFAGRAIRLGTLRPGETVDLRGRPSGALADYVRPLRSSSGWGRGPYRFRRWQAEVRREDADTGARWVSLFGFQSEGDDRFRRWVQTGEREEQGYSGSSTVVESTVFDMSANLQLAGLTSGASAVVLYSVDRSFADILLSDRRPRSWDRSVVRLRVPVPEEEETLGDGS